MKIVELIKYVSLHIEPDLSLGTSGSSNQGKNTRQHWWESFSMWLTHPSSLILLLLSFLCYQESHWLECPQWQD